ncbi:MAG: GDYXXLXY domain-containing protein, partial [Pacificimonas sp.]
GYDPRDILRGRYIALRYDWALEGNWELCGAGGCRICIEGEPPNGGRARLQSRLNECRYPIDPDASALALGRRGPRSGFQATGRIFVSETTAPELEAELRANPMQMRALLTRRGRLIAEELVPAPSRAVTGPASKTNLDLTLSPERPE